MVTEGDIEVMGPIHRLLVTETLVSHATLFFFFLNSLLLTYFYECALLLVYYFIKVMAPCRSLIRTDLFMGILTRGTECTSLLRTSILNSL